MNTFNRVFTLVGLVVLAVLGAFALVLPSATLGLLHSIANSVHSGILGGASDVGRLLLRLLAAVVYVAAIGAVFWLEVKGFGSRTVEVQRSTGGRIRLTTRDLEERIRRQVDAISGVVSTRVRVKEQNNTVVASLVVETLQDTDPVVKGEEVAAVTRLVVQDQLGIKLSGKPQVTVKAARPLPRPKLIEIASRPTRLSDTLPAAPPQTAEQPPAPPDQDTTATDKPA